VPLAVTCSMDRCAIGTAVLAGGPQRAWGTYEHHPAVTVEALAPGIPHAGWNVQRTIHADNPAAPWRSLQGAPCSAVCRPLASRFKAQTLVRPGNDPGLQRASPCK